MANNFASDQRPDTEMTLLNGGSKKAAWSESETQQLKNLLSDPTRTVQTIAKLLDRSVPSVKSRMRRLSFSRVDPGRPWTNEELEKLRGFFESDLTQTRMARILGRSETTVRAKLYYLGLRRPARYTKIAP
jgi:DNA-binding transcriptional regulator YiaG